MASVSRGPAAYQPTPADLAEMAREMARLDRLMAMRAEDLAWWAEESDRLAARDAALTRPDPDDRREREPEACEWRGGGTGHPSRED